MKKTLTTLSMGACVLLAFNSCQSTDGDGYSGYEEATPMSEMTVADGEIPPWLLEDSSGIQVDAGATTHNPNTFPIPEPGEAAYESGASASADQRQPELASNDVTIETNQDDIIVAPLEQPENPVITPAESTTTTAAVATESKPKYTATKATVSAKKPGKKDSQKTARRVTEPTLVTYKVKPGDNLSEIARRSNTTVAAIRKASGITGDTIYAGSTIKVPYTPKGYKADTASSKSTTHTVKRGETLSDIAAKHGTSVQALLKANNLTLKQANRIYAGKKLIIPGKGGKAGSTASSSSSKSSSTYVVRNGDTVSDIAAANGISTQELLKANNMNTTQASRIRPGQKLTIPGKASSGKKKSRSKKRRR